MTPFVSTFGRRRDAQGAPANAALLLQHLYHRRQSPKIPLRLLFFLYVLDYALRHPFSRSQKQLKTSECLKNIAKPSSVTRSSLPLLSAVLGARAQSFPYIG